VLALMLKISTAIADAGFPADAAKRVEHTYQQVLAQELSVQPEQVLQIFEIWAALDASSATQAAETLAAAVSQNGPSVFELAIWTGIVNGLAQTKQDSTVYAERAQVALKAAPERAAALLLAPRLAD